MSWVTNFTEALLYQELLPPGTFSTNTLSSADLASKLRWCQQKRADISSRELHGDEYVAARRFLEWLDYHEALLQHWINTLPVAANGTQ